MRLAITCGCAVLVLWACTESDRSSRERESSSATSGSSTATGVPDGPFSVVVNAVESYNSLMQVTPATGNRFVTLDLTLFNVSVSTPLSMAQTNFSLQTDASLVVQAHSVSGTLQPTCRSDVAVAAGGMASCQLAFEVATAQAPTTLQYDDKQGHTFTAAVPMIILPPQPCEAVGIVVLAPFACSDCTSTFCDSEIAAWDNGGCLSDENTLFQCVHSNTHCACIDQAITTPGCKELYIALMNCAAAHCVPDCTRGSGASSSSSAASGVGGAG